MSEPPRTAERVRARETTIALWWFIVLALTAIATAAAASLLVGGSRPVLAVTVGVAPTPLGVWLVWRAAGPAAARALVRRVLRWRFAPAYYAIALLMAPAVNLGAQVLALAAGEPGPDRWILSPTEALSPALLALVPIIVLTEIGWRGVALPAAMISLGSVAGALVIGLAEGLWSLGMVVLGTTDLPRLGVLAVLASAVVWSPIWAVLTQRTGGSLLATILFHLSVVYWADVTPGDRVGNGIALGLYALAAVAAAMLLPRPRFSPLIDGVGLRSRASRVADRWRSPA
jgi:hypothetical protein